MFVNRRVSTSVTEEVPQGDMQQRSPRCAASPQSRSRGQAPPLVESVVMRSSDDSLIPSAAPLDRVSPMHPAAATMWYYCGIGGLSCSLSLC